MKTIPTIRYRIVSDGDHDYACPVDMAGEFYKHREEFEESQNSGNHKRMAKAEREFPAFIEKHCLKIEGDFTFENPQ